MAITADELYSELRSRGLSHNHALGMVANARGESSFNPSAVGDAGTSYGLFQWHGPRASALEGMTPDWRTNWRGQIDYAMTEPDTRRYLEQDFASPEQATEWFTRQWERPADPDREVRKRVKALPNLLSGEVPTPAMAASSMPSLVGGEGFLSPDSPLGGGLPQEAPSMQIPAMASPGNASMTPAVFQLPASDTSQINLPEMSMAQRLASNPFLQMGLGILGAGNLGGASQGLLAAAQAENQFAQMQQTALQNQQMQRQRMFNQDLARANLALSSQQAQRRHALDQADLDWRIGQDQREQQRSEAENARMMAARQIAMNNASNPDIARMIGLGMLDDRLPDLLGPPPSADPEAVKSVRQEFRGLKDISQYEAGQRAYNSLDEILSTTGNPADALAALYTFMRSLDPESVVREGEQVMFLKSEGPFGALAAEFQRIKGEGRITKTQRKNLIDTAKKMLAGSYKSAKQEQDYYKRIAREQYKVDPFYIVGETYKEPELPEWAQGAKPSDSPEGTPSEPTDDEVDRLYRQLNPEPAWYNPAGWFGD